MFYQNRKTIPKMRKPKTLKNMARPIRKTPTTSKIKEYHNSQLKTNAEAYKEKLSTIYEKLGISSSTWYRKIDNVHLFSEADKRMIARLLNRPVSVLFPELQTAA